MSAYQYYEFQAVDRPLTKEQMAELRKLSSRASITSTRFTNFYNFGNFRGDPQVLMERYFDAFVYFANWGTRQLMLRLPRNVLDPETAERYASDENLMVHATPDYTIVEFLSQDEDGEYIEDGSEWMPALLPLRAELAAGDLRCLYLGWLKGAETGQELYGYDDAGYGDDDEDGDGESEYEDEEAGCDDAPEPPIPPGLGNLSAALTALAEFLGIDEDLIAVAAERSAPSDDPAISNEALERWIHDLPASEKDRLLLRLVRDDAPQLRAEVLQRYRRANAPPRATGEGDGSPRTVGQLLAAAEARAEARRREEAECQAREQARKQREQAAARAKYLDTLVGREPALWQSVTSLVAATKPKQYDQAVQILTDLRDLAARRGTTDEFRERLRALRSQHAKKPSLIARFDRAGLGG